MDKRCGNCKHKGYAYNPYWPFCTCKAAHEVGWEWKDHIEQYQKSFGIDDKIDKDNMSPSCMMVQSGYSELYNTTCPYMEEE